MHLPPSKKHMTHTPFARHPPSHPSPTAGSCSASPGGCWRALEGSPLYIPLTGNPSERLVRMKIPPPGGRKVPTLSADAQPLPARNVTARGCMLRRGPHEPVDVNLW